MAAVTTWEQQIDEWLHSDRKFAETCLLENGSVGRMFTVHTRGGNDVPIHAAWDDAATKASTLALVRVLGLALDAVAIGCVGEAWVVLNPTTGDMETRPASNALRKECVVISIEGRAEGGSGTLRRLAVLEIIRDGGPGGKPVGTRPIEMPEIGSADGGFANLLSPAQPPVGARDAALKALEDGGFRLPDELDPRKRPVPH